MGSSELPGESSKRATIRMSVQKGAGPTSGGIFSEFNVIRHVFYFGGQFRKKGIDKCAMNGNFTGVPAWRDDGNNNSLSPFICLCNRD